MAQSKRNLTEFLNYLDSDDTFCILDSTDLAAPYSYSEDLLFFLKDFENTCNQELKSEYVLENLKSLSIEDLESSIAQYCTEEETRPGTISSLLNSGFIKKVVKELLNRK